MGAKMPIKPEGEGEQTLEQLQNGQLALALCRALMICLVKLDDRFLNELSGSLAEVAEKLKDEKGAGTEQVISNLVTFSRSLSVDSDAAAAADAAARGRLH
jgi:hypothetical protein